MLTGSCVTSDYSFSQLVLETCVGVGGFAASSLSDSTTAKKSPSSKCALEWYQALYASRMGSGIWRDISGQGSIAKGSVYHQRGLSPKDVTGTKKAPITAAGKGVVLVWDARGCRGETTFEPVDWSEA